MNPKAYELPIWYQAMQDYSSLHEMANAADPQSHPWGYFAWHHGFACGPLTLGAFMWYTSRDEMLQGLVQGELQLEYAGSIPHEELGHQQSMCKIADQLAAGELDLQTAALAFSKPYDFLKVEWIGRFEDLLHGSNAFALEVRKQFHHIHSNSVKSQFESSAEIAAHELPAFIALLNEWGI